MPHTNDLGGKSEFFGPIAHTPSEPAFHAEWQARVFGINNFLLSVFAPAVDEFRGRLAALPPEDYFVSYYHRWLNEMERTWAPYTSGDRPAPRAKVVATARALRVVFGRPTLPRLVNTKVMPKFVSTLTKTSRDARYAVGDTVRVREQSPGHTQQPGYTSGRVGRVADHRGAAVFPDALVDRGEKVTEHLYVVAFDGTELWGEKAEPNTEVLVELFEPYLEPA